MPEHVTKTHVGIRLPKSSSSSSPRSVEKIHVSDVLNFIGLKTGVLDGGKKFSDESTSMRLALGLAWEDYIAAQYPEIQYHPGEFELDGIVGSPDGIEEGFTMEEAGVEGELAVAEFKLTWLSGRWQLNERTNRIRMWQVLAYCKLLELRNVSLWVGYINGDYNREGPKVFAPDPVIYRIRFSRREVEKNWDMMVANVPPMLWEWKQKGWWEGSVSKWGDMKGAGHTTQKKLDESDIFDLDTMEDAISA